MEFDDDDRLDKELDDKLRLLEDELEGLHCQGCSCSGTPSSRSSFDHEELMQEMMAKVSQSKNVRVGSQRGSALRVEDVRPSYKDGVLRERENVRMPIIPAVYSRNSIESLGSMQTSSDCHHSEKGQLAIAKLEHQLSSMQASSKADSMRMHVEVQNLRQKVKTLEKECESLRSQLVASQNGKQDLVATMEVLSERNRLLQNDLITAHDKDKSKRELDLLKETVAELERQRLSDERLMAGVAAKHEAEVNTLRSILAGRFPENEVQTDVPVVGSIRRVGGLSLPSQVRTVDTAVVSPSSAVCPPWATHEETCSPGTQKIFARIVPPEVKLREPTASAALDTSLLKLNVERQQLESKLGRIVGSGKTIAQKKEKEEIVGRLSQVDYLLLEVKQKLKERKG